MRPRRLLAPMLAACAAATLACGAGEQYQAIYGEYVLAAHLAREGDTDGARRQVRTLHSVIGVVMLDLSNGNCAL